jgi:tetratricopeptide (TPR) repeat protein
LGRLYRAWAFGDAVAPDQAPTNQLLRDFVQDSPDQVDMDKLHRSQAYYEEAVALSPQNAQLRNELATVLYILGDNAGALVTLDRSLELDPRYGQTYLLQGDALAAIGDNEAALAAYRLAAARNPGDLNILSAIGVLSAESGQPDAALDVFGQIAESDAAMLSAIEGELAALDAQAAAAGGYELLTPAARERRDALLGQQAAYRSQLHFTYRNMALVLRDAKRVDEAIAAAEQALSYANDGQRSGVESLLAQLRDGEAP